jgi:ketosteroid isomerase-like protein
METNREKNIALVRDGINKFLKGNIGEMLDDFSDDIVWNSYQNQNVPYARLYKGKKATGEFFNPNYALETTKGRFT